MKKKLFFSKIFCVLTICILPLSAIAQDCSTVNGITITATPGQIVMEGQSGTEYIFLDFGRKVP